MTEPNDEVITIRCTLDGEEIQLSRAAPASRAEFLRGMMENSTGVFLHMERTALPVCLVAEILKHCAAAAAGAGGEVTFLSLADVAPEALMDAPDTTYREWGCQIHNGYMVEYIWNTCIVSEDVRYIMDAW